MPPTSEPSIDAGIEVVDARGRRYVPLDKPVFAIGRRTAADLQVVATDVSREHAEIICADGAYVLRDKGSRYGTFVNGEAVRERALAPAPEVDGLAERARRCEAWGRAIVVSRLPVTSSANPRSILPIPMNLSPGTTIGPYRISGPLGKGGMGEVWRAHDSRLGRDVPSTRCQSRDSSR